MGRKIIIEGSIGSGKSSLGKLMVTHLYSIGYKAIYIPEFFNQDLLDYYIENMKSQAYAFQIIMIRERIRLIKEADKYLDDGYDFVFIDRGIYGDLAFAKMLYEQHYISEREYKIYANLSKFDNINNSKYTDTILYLKCNIDTIIERINKRGIVSEINGYSPEYLDNLSKTHDTIFDYINGGKNCLDNITIDIINYHKHTSKIITLDYNKNLYEDIIHNTDIIKEYIGGIIKLINN